MQLHQEFVRRAKIAGQLSLSYLHHHVMDRMISGRANGFSFEDIVDEAATDPTFRKDVAIGGNRLRARLVVIRALEGLVAVGMLRDELTSDGSRYFFCQNSSSENSREHPDQ